MPGEQDREGGRAAAGLSQAMRERACRVDVALHAVGHHEEVATTTVSMFLVIFIFCKGSCHWYFSSWSSLGEWAGTYLLHSLLVVGVLFLFFLHIYLVVCATSCMYE